MELTIIEFESYEKSVTAALDALDVRERIKAPSGVLIKPNLINDSPPPITTPAACCEAIVNYVQACSDTPIVIAEGCGDSGLETKDVFAALGYTALARKYGISLLDLNHAPLTTLQRPECPVFPEMVLPEIAFTHMIISVPVLKAHSLAGITGSLKNMLGFAPSEHYSGRHGSWKKAVFHGRMQQSIIDLNRYIVPDLTVMDASVGMAEYHLGGPRCDPPVAKIVAGCNPWVVDREAARLLHMDWQAIEHVRAGFENTMDGPGNPD
ncbi:MAG: DUF362 domain-containing protein [Desulfobacterales bacterium]|nr:DUF362 domain-containing protein [Desulfobacterales bacterium]